MSALNRRPDPPSTGLLMRILEQPGVAAAVRAMPGAELAELIDRIGLEDAGELIALASAEQLQRVFDDDLWRADRVGGDETFRPERFALWLRVMSEAGDEALVRRLCELPDDLLALAVHRLVLVLDMDVVEEQLGWAGDEAAPIQRALEGAAFEEWEEFRLIARQPEVWHDIWNALLLLDREEHARLRAILQQCCAMSTEYINGQGGLYQVLTAEEMLEDDVAAARDDRRAGEGFISPADARAFLELARRDRAPETRDPITRAYFRRLQQPDVTLAAAPPAAEVKDLAVATERVAPFLEQALNDLRQSDPTSCAARIRELGYLVNVWMAAGAHDGRRPRPVEALETVLRTCEAGLLQQLGEPAAGGEQAAAALMRTPADLLFRRGFAR